MTEVVVQLWLVLKITGLKLIKAVILHFIFGYWEFCDYLLLILAWMLILYLMTLSARGGWGVCVGGLGGGGDAYVCVCVCWGVKGGGGWSGLSSSQVWHYFSNSCFLIKRN